MSKDRNRIALNEKHEVQYLRKISRILVNNRTTGLPVGYVSVVRIAKAFLKLTSKKEIKKLTNFNEILLKNNKELRKVWTEDTRKLEQSVFGWKLTAIILTIIAFVLGIGVGKYMIPIT